MGTEFELKQNGNLYKRLSEKRLSDFKSHHTSDNLNDIADELRYQSELLALIEQYHVVINKLDKCKGNNSQLNLLLREKTKIQLKLHKLTLLTSESNTAELINKVVQKRNETIKRLSR